MTSLLGAVSGLVYILVNAGKLPDTPAIALRILAILVFVGVYLAIRHAPAEDEDPRPGESRFDRRYWILAIVELVVGIAGIAIIAGPLQHEEASVAWISLIVGIHLAIRSRISPDPAARPLASTAGLGSTARPGPTTGLGSTARPATGLGSTAGLGSTSAPGWTIALGLAIGLCGLAGLVLAFAGGSDEAVAAAGGILPGAILLSASWWSAHLVQRAVAAQRSAAPRG